MRIRTRPQASGLTSPNSAARLSEGIERHGQHDDDTDDDLLDVGRDVHQHETVEQYPNQDRTDDRTENGTEATKKAGTADYDGGDDGKFVAGAGNRFR